MLLRSLSSFLFHQENKAKSLLSIWLPIVELRINHKGGMCSSTFERFEMSFCQRTTFAFSNLNSIVLLFFTTYNEIFVNFFHIRPRCGPLVQSFVGYFLFNLLFCFSRFLHCTEEDLQPHLKRISEKVTTAISILVS